MMQHCVPLFQWQEYLETGARAWLAATEDGGAPLRQYFAHHGEADALMAVALRACAGHEGRAGALGWQAGAIVDEAELETGAAIDGDL